MRDQSKTERQLYVRLYDPSSRGWPWCYAVCWRDEEGIEHIETLHTSVDGDTARRLADEALDRMSGS